MSCSGSLAPFSTIPDSSSFASFVATFEPKNDRCLILSDSPETILTTPAPPKTLYKCEIPIASSPFIIATKRKFRAYVYHVNLTVDPIFVHLIASLRDGSSGKAQSRKRYEGIGTNYSGYGICSARAHLFNELDYDSSEPTLSANEVVLRTWTVPPRIDATNGTLVCAIEDFEVELTSSLSLNEAARIRIAVSSDSSIGAWSDPVEAAVLHQRGWWPYSNLNLETTTPVFDVNPEVLPDGKYVQFGEQNGKHMDWYKLFPIVDPHGYGGNKGLFGVDGTFRFWVVNSNETLSALLHVFVRAHMHQGGNADHFVGAGKVPFQTDYKIAKILGDDAINEPHSVLLGTIGISPTLTPVAVDVKLAVGATSTLNQLFVLGKADPT